MKVLKLHHRPSALYTLIRAFLDGKQYEENKHKMPMAEARWLGLKLNRKYLDQFSDICEIERQDFLSPLYPFTLIYPLNLRLLSQKHIRIAMFKMLTTRNHCTLYRKIHKDEKLDITSAISGQQYIKRGLEFFIDSKIMIDSEKIWTNRSVLFIPGWHLNDTKNYVPFKLDPIESEKEEVTWHLGNNYKYRFSRILGDSNGIHYSSKYAKLVGFKQATAHPIRIAAKCINHFLKYLEDLPLSIDLMFKGPVYYNKELTMKTDTIDIKKRFDLYCQGNDRPSISGLLSND